MPGKDASASAQGLRLEVKIEESKAELSKAELIDELLTGSLEVGPGKVSGVFELDAVLGRGSKLAGAA